MHAGREELIGMAREAEELKGKDDDESFYRRTSILQYLQELGHTTASLLAPTQMVEAVGAHGCEGLPSLRVLT